MSLFGSAVGSVLGTLAGQGAATTFDVARLFESAVKGRASSSWAPTGGTITGVLSQARAADVALYSQRQQHISHVLAIAGARADQPVAVNDFLEAGGVRYWVVDVIDPSGLGLYTRLVLDERHGPIEGTA